MITIFIVGLLLFFLNHFNKEVYDGFDKYFNNSQYNDTTAHEALQKFQTLEGTSIWDYAFLAIFIGLMIQMLLFSFATRINIAFYWIFALVGIMILIVGTVLSNVWQEIVANPVFSETILRFPIANMLLGTYYPIAVVGFLFLGMIVLFGKPPSREGFQ